MYQSRVISDYCILKDYKEFKKLVLIKNFCNPCFERKKSKLPRGMNNENKLENSLSRAKNKVFEYAVCNDFKYFITLTIDGSKFPRDDIGGFVKVFSKWLSNYQRKAGKINYLFIPERHHDKINWHLHGLISDVPLSDLCLFKECDPVPKHLIENGYFNWLPYFKKFGFCSLSVIKNKMACSKYITKYISKGISDGMGITEMNKQLYYCSKGLETAKTIKKGTLVAPFGFESFENKYVKIKIIENNSANIKFYIKNII